MDDMEWNHITREWCDCPESSPLAGWKIMTGVSHKLGDENDFWKVAIWNGKEGSEKVREAFGEHRPHLVSHLQRMQQEARFVRDMLPKLVGWIADKQP